MSRRGRHAAKHVCLLALAPAVVGCGLLLATPAGETRMGEVAAADIEEQVGLVETPALQTYVRAIGERLASERGVRADVTFRFHVVDMAEPNAFALPGGHVYVSRGLLVLLNDEDELASVLGHEVGHVSARHHMKHAMLQTPFVPVRLAAGIGGAAVMLVAAPFGGLGAPLRAGGAAIAGLGGATGALSLSAHSRAQENEADEIGQKLAAAGGWDPEGMARVMETLSRDARLRGSDPEKGRYLDTHPTSPERAKRTAERAAGLQRADIAPIARDRARFLAELEGLLVGDPADDGVVVGREFLHAELDLRVAFPDGWEIENGINNVTASPSNDDRGEEVFATLSIAAEGDDPEAVAREALASSRLQVDGEPVRRDVGALRAVHATARDRHSRTPYRIAVSWIAHGDLVYQVLAAAPEARWERYRAPLSAVAESFRPLEAADRDRITEDRLRVVQARRGDSLERLIGRYATPWDVATAAVANAVEEDVALQAGQPVKLALSEIHRPAARAKEAP